MLLLGLIASVAMQPEPARLRFVFEEGLKRRRQEYGAVDPRTAQAARDLGQFLATNGDNTAARQPLQEAVQIDEQLYGLTAEQTLSDVAQLAGVSPATQAEPLWARVATSTDVVTSAQAWASLGDIRATSNNRAGAAEAYRKALGRLTAGGQQDTPNAARLMNSLAATLPPVEAVTLLEQALAIDRQTFGARHPESASVEANLAHQLLLAGRPDDSLRAAADAMAIFQQTLGAKHPRVALAASVLAKAFQVKGDRIRAERLLRIAIEIDEDAYGPGHPQTVSDRKALNEFLRSAPSPGRR